ncbi:phosphohydrolase [Tenacibaculum sp. SZ-18]|uniref:HD domain-containing protein n=1 Tax=Tenacibaculum sp. SZ-18 TaxID=754423 RepID=UPI000C2CFC85|nr:HD domain-containing protein [Tenacibaculum sp. SZ-18]AUC14852.1 phosphohydrolase [Tenacibaculum sp. SZ-18]
MTTSKTNKLKILNDPIYGLVSIPNSLIFDIIEHRYFQRLRRVSQMGLTNLVYPGANHTRFHHAIGCMHLMQKAIQILRTKNVSISEDEATALSIAILLHDIGHGAFSHALEYSIVNEITHEEISLKFMKKLNEEFSGQLNLAINIFEGKYERKFFNQLISSQLDIDRLDYLKRDSFYTGVTEGNISSDRLITMMNVKNDELVIERKGIYSVEKFLIARRLMYWQVYLHKTSLSAETLLVKVLQRAKELAKKGEELPTTESLRYFLYNAITDHNFSDEALEVFSRLDDYDVFASMKQWCYHDDIVLSNLSKMIIERKLFCIEIQDKPFSEKKIEKLKVKLQEKFDINEEHIDYFVFLDTASNQTYDLEKPIKILNKNGKTKDILKASDHLNLKTLSKPVVKYYCCYPKKF